jgi:Spy/CpxP family protein refolding chaperone
MRKPLLNTLLVCCCVVLFTGALLSAQAQAGHAPPPPPPGGGHAGGWGGNGGVNNAGSLSTNNANITRNGIKLGPPGRWWDDRGFVQTLGLSHDQQKKMDVIFNTNKPIIIAAYKDFEKQQAAVQALSKSANVDKNQLFAAIDAANQARAALEKANTEMLLQIRGQLDSGQVNKLESMP